MRWRIGLRNAGAKIQSPDHQLCAIIRRGWSQRAKGSETIYAWGKGELAMRAIG